MSQNPNELIARKEGEKRRVCVQCAKKKTIIISNIHTYIEHINSTFSKMQKPEVCVCVLHNCWFWGHCFHLDRVIYGGFQFVNWDKLFWQWKLLWFIRRIQNWFITMIKYTHFVADGSGCTYSAAMSWKIKQKSYKKIKEQQERTHRPYIPQADR